MGSKYLSANRLVIVQYLALVLPVGVAIARVSTIVRGISQASIKQTAGVERIDKAISQIDDASRQNASLVQHATAAARSLEEQAAVLVDSVAVFRLNPERKAIPEKNTRFAYR